MWNKLQIGHKSGNIEMRTVQLALPIRLGIRLLYISDLHFNRFSSNRADQLAGIINAQKPDILLLGGDYADTRAGLVPLRDLLSSFPKHLPALAVAGNHDYFIGIDRLRNIMAGYGVSWIEKSSRQVLINGQTIHVDGNFITKDACSPGHRILCLHRPVSLRHAESHYDLALAGHLHGCQFIFWQNENGLYPGRWFYRWNILEKQVGRCRYVVSRGVGDTLPLRINCTREVVLVEL